MQSFNWASPRTISSANVLQSGAPQTPQSMPGSFSMIFSFNFIFLIALLLFLSSGAKGFGFTPCSKEKKLSLYNFLTKLISTLFLPPNVLISLRILLLAMNLFSTVRGPPRQPSGQIRHSRYSISFNFPDSTSSRIVIVSYKPDTDTELKYFRPLISPPGIDQPIPMPLIRVCVCSISGLFSFFSFIITLL
ncbi:hypothetical protein ES705_48954 [subsurface metagenome]